MTTEFDVLNTSWETFQRVIHENHSIYNRQNNYNDNYMASTRIPSFQELFESPSMKSSEEDSDSSFFDSFFSPESILSPVLIKQEEDSMNDDLKIQENFNILKKNEDNKRNLKEFIKKDKQPFTKKQETIELRLKSNKISEFNIPNQKSETIRNNEINNNNNNINKNTDNNNNIENNNNKSILSKKNVTKSPTKRADTVRNTWYNNLQQIISNSMIPLKRCLYKFENPTNSPWDSKDGLYIFEIHLLQVLCPKEAWNFKRYVDNHSKKAGEGQTFTLCSSIHKDEWEKLEMKSNKFFKKARMININAFKEKNGFITKGKWKYIYNIFQKEFQECIINTFNVK